MKNYTDMFEDMTIDGLIEYLQKYREENDNGPVLLSVGEIGYTSIIRFIAVLNKKGQGLLISNSDSLYNHEKL